MSRKLEISVESCAQGVTRAGICTIALIFMVCASVVYKASRLINLQALKWSVNIGRFLWLQLLVRFRRENVSPVDFLRQILPVCSSWLVHFQR